MAALGAVLNVIASRKQTQCANTSWKANWGVLDTSPHVCEPNLELSQLLSQGWHVSLNQNDQADGEAQEGDSKPCQASQGTATSWLLSNASTCPNGKLLVRGGRWNTPQGTTAAILQCQTHAASTTCEARHVRNPSSSTCCSWRVAVKVQGPPHALLQCKAPGPPRLNTTRESQAERAQGEQKCVRGEESGDTIHNEKSTQRNFNANHQLLTARMHTSLNRAPSPHYRNTRTAAPTGRLAQ